MRTFTFFLVLLFSSIMMSAQINLTSNNVVGVNDVVYLGNDTLPDSTIVPGNSGPSQIWDFSALTAHNQDTMHFMNPANTPYDTSFTGDNISTYFSDINSYVYFIKNTSGVENIGLVGDVTGTGVMEVPVIPSETIMKFPFTYQSSFQDTSGMTMIMDTIKSEQTTYKTVESDAWGTLITPLGSFDALRIKTTKIDNQTIYIWATVTWIPVYSQSDTTFRYEWWTDNITYRYPLAGFDWDTTNNQIIGEVEFLQDLYNLKDEINAEKSDIKVYPNPTNSNMYIVGEDVNHIDVYSMDGKKMLQFSFTGKNNKYQLDLSILPKGMYMLNIKTDKGFVPKNIVIN